MTIHLRLILCLLLGFGLFWLLGTQSARAEPMAPTVAAFPFFDDFETGVIGADWTTNSWGSGRAEISSDAPHSAANHIFLGQKVGGQSGASLELLIDLSSQTDASLDFWWRGARKATNDENGVYMSDDGKNWKKVANLNGNPPAYGHFLIDIDKAAAANGLTLNRQFHIRFYYHSQWDFEEGGLRLDDVSVTTRANTVAAFPLEDGFESATYHQGFYPHSWGPAFVEVSAEDPYTGTSHLFLGQRIGGQSGAAVDLVIDLANQTDVFLDFWWRGTGKAINTQNAVYISEDGSTWKYIATMNGNPQVYGHTLINIADAASANGLTLNNQFYIRFYYHSQWDFEEGGLRLDNVRLTTRANVVASFPLDDNFESATYHQGFYPNSWGPAFVEMSNENPYSGINHIFLGQKIGGQSGASFDLLVDLLNQPDVFLDFWWRGTGKAKNAQNGVYISENGSNWKLVKGMSGNPQTYSHAVIDIAEAAAANGLLLNNQFHIRIYYHSQWDFEEGGLRIDDLRLGADDPSKIGRSFLYLPLVRR